MRERPQPPLPKMYGSQYGEPGPLSSRPWVPPRDGSSAGHTRHQRAEGHQPHCTKHAGIQTGFCKIHHSPSTGSLSNQPMSPGIQLSSFGETQKHIKIKMLRFFKKKKNSVQQSTMFNLFKKKKIMVYRKHGTSLA